MKHPKHFVYLVFTVTVLLLTLKSQAQLLKPFSSVYTLSENVPIYICPTIEPNTIEGMNDNEFGVVFNTNITLNNSGILEEIDGFKVWRQKIVSSGALSMMVVLENFNFPTESSLFMYNNSATHVFGPYTENYNTSSNILPSPLILGDTLVIEVVYNANINEIPSFTIAQIGHDYKGMILTSGDKNKTWDLDLECFNDVNCDVGDDWQVAKQSVVKIITIQPISETLAACTGFLINDVDNSNTPFLYTANHCIASEDLANRSTFYFNYEREKDDCNDDSKDGHSNHFVCGATLKTRHPDTDYLLLELNSRVPSSFRPYYAGWDRNSDAPNETTIIHHPAGHVKKNII